MYGMYVQTMQPEIYDKNFISMYIKDMVEKIRNFYDLIYLSTYLVYGKAYMSHLIRYMTNSGLKHT